MIDREEHEPERRMAAAAGAETVTSSFAPPARSDVTSGLVDPSLFQKIIRGGQTFVDRYRGKIEIGRGGMGVVLQVRDSNLNRDLAMKVMRRDAHESTAAASGITVELARFLEEAQITAQLEHPGIVPVHDVGVDHSGRVFFTMRLVKGRDLQFILGLTRNQLEGWNLLSSTLGS